MRPTYRPHRGLAVVSACLTLAAIPVRAQEPAAAPVVRALKVGTLHPIAGPAIEGGVLVIRGREILAIGRSAEVEIPAGAEVLEFPTAHAYPGMVDALSTAFADQRLLEDGTTNAGSDIADGLDRFDETGRTLVAAGVTTAYISSRAKTAWRGKGAIIRPRRDGFETFGEARTATSVSVRLGVADDAHPLARQKEIRGVEASFEGLEAYTNQKKKHAESLAQYESKFAEYLEWHRKRSAGDQPRGAPRNEGDARQPQDPPAEAKAEDASPSPSGDGASEAPKRPTYPPPFRADPAKEALLAVRAGELTLRADARHAHEIEAALRMARESSIPKLVLEHAIEAEELATQLRDAGVAVVLCDLQPDGERAVDVDPARLPGVLSRAGVEFCLASGAARASRHLPLLAAYACGGGLDESEALAAITLQAARVLGVADRVGSLEAGKLADVIVSSGPLLAPDSRILHVLSGGETQFEEK